MNLYKIDFNIKTQNQKESEDKEPSKIEPNIEQRKINVYKEDDLKSKSLEKKSFFKFKDNKNYNNLDNNKIDDKRIITSKSYINIEEKDNKKEPKEEKRRTWKFTVVKKENDVIKEIDNKIEEIKEKKDENNIMIFKKEKEIIEDKTPKITYNYTKSEEEGKEKEINKYLPNQDSIPKKKAYEYKKDEFSSNIKVIDSKNINIITSKEENKGIDKITNDLDKNEKEEIKTSWRLGVRNKYEQKNKQISKSEKQEKIKYDYNESNFENEKRKIDTKKKENISIRNKYELEKKEKQKLEDNQEKEKTKADKEIKKEFNIDKTDSEKMAFKDEVERRKNIEIISKGRMELKPEKMNIQDNIVKPKDINEPKKFEYKKILEENRQYSTENKNIEKNKIISEKPKEPSHKILTKSKSEKKDYSFKIKNKKDDDITELQEQKVNIITKEIQKPKEEINRFYKKEIQIKPIDIKEKREDNKQEIIAKRYEKKEVRRIPYLDKSQSKENIIEQTNIYYKSKFALDKDVNKLTDNNKLINNIYEKEKDKKHEIKHDIKKKGIIEQTQNEDKKKEIKEKEKEKYIKNKDLINISRNVIEENKTTNIEKNNINIIKTKENVDKMKYKQIEPIKKGDIIPQTKIETQEKEELKDKQQIIEVPRKSYIHMSPRIKSKNIINAEEEKEIYSYKKYDYSQGKKKDFTFNKNEKKSELDKFKDSIEIKKEKKERKEKNKYNREEPIYENKKLKIKQKIRDLDIEKEELKEEETKEKEEIIEKEKQKKEEELLKEQQLLKRMKLEKIEIQKIKREQKEIARQEKERIKREQEEYARQEKERIENEQRILEEKERVEKEEKRKQKEKEELNKKNLLEKINTSKETQKDNAIKKSKYLQKNEKYKETPLPQEEQIKELIPSKKIHKSKKSIFSTTSSDNFSLANKKNIYQRKESQESNSKISSTSGKDKKYISKRYSKIKNILTEGKLQSFTSNEIISKTETKEKDELIKEDTEDIYEEINESKNLEEDIDNRKRKSKIFKFKYLDVKKATNKERIKTEKKENYKEEEEESDTFKNKENINLKNAKKKEIEEEEYSAQINDLDEETQVKNIYKKIKKEKKAKKYPKKDLYKKNLQIETKDKYYDYDLSNNDNLENLISESNFKKIQYTQEEKNIDDLISIKKNLPLKIKVYQCIIYKNTDPSLNEEQVKDTIHKRNKSQGINKSLIIKIPEGFDIYDKRENDDIDIEEIKKEKASKKKKFRMSFLKASNSTAAM